MVSKKLTVYPLTREAKGSPLSRKDKRANVKAGAMENGRIRKMNQDGSERKRRRTIQEQLDDMADARLALQWRGRIQAWEKDGAVSRLKAAVGLLKRIDREMPLNGLPRIILELKGLQQERMAALEDGATVWVKDDSDD